MARIADIVRITTSKDTDQSLKGQVKGAQKRFQAGTKGTR